MAETKPLPNQPPGSGTESSPPRDRAGAMRAASEPGRQGAAAATTAGAAGDAAMTTSTMAEMPGRAAGAAAAAGAEALRQGLRRGGEAGADFGMAATEGGRHLIEDAAEHVEQVARRMAEAVRDTASDMGRLADLPGAAADGLQDMQGATARLAAMMVQANMRAAQDLFRLVGPGAVVAVQRRYLRECLDSLLEGSAVVLRATHRATDGTLRPLERHCEERRLSRQREAHGGCVADVMSTHVRIASPEDTVQQVARMMGEEDTGMLPVGEGDRLVGVVTDRDLALRLAAEGKDPARTKVREVMTPDLRYVFEDEDLDHAAENMAEQQVRRLPVVNRAKRLVGIVSLGDLARNGHTQHLAARALTGIRREGGPHNQGTAAATRWHQ